LKEDIIVLTIYFHPNSYFSWLSKAIQKGSFFSTSYETLSIRNFQPKEDIITITMC
jgi:hypothetical protein